MGRIGRAVARALPFVMLAVATASAQAAQPPQPPQPPDDGDIRDAVVRRLLERVLPEAGAIYVSVRDGTVNLRGTAANAWTRTQALEETMQVPGVKSVSSDITVPRVADATINEQIDLQLFRYVFYTIFDIVYAVSTNGVVTIEGVVTEPFKAAEIEMFVARVPGVFSVSNSIRTVAASAQDDQLRVAIASRLYRLPGFWKYSVLAAPPIHIAVERGRVTLFGDVDAASGRDLAGSIVMGLPGVVAFDNLIRVKK
jgi:hyperosmotically inducible periplasmic protein